MYRFLIVGAQFGNKGAQSMLFITVDEIKKRFPEAEIYYAGTDFGDDEYTFKWIYRTGHTMSIAMGGAKGFAHSILTIAKDTVKKVIGRNNNLWRMFELKNIMPEITAIIDVSGFNLGKKWNDATHLDYLSNIRLAQKYNIPIFLMPQSFGPFDYDSSRSWIIEDMKELLPYAKIIYAREEEGRCALVNELGLKNVVLSTDLVLQNKGVDTTNIYLHQKVFDLPEIHTTGNVGIVPNKQCFNFGENTVILQMYSGLVKQLLAAGKNVYLFRHSREDLEYCSLIYEEFRDTDGVYLIENDFSCLEYDEFVKNFDFIICSRYHGIVHAYRNAVPCIALGWAIKYQEVTRKVNQGQYAIDITEEGNLIDRVINMVQDMIVHYAENSDIIRHAVEQLQNDNCFDVLDGLK